MADRSLPLIGIAVLIVSALCACGQKGPLYLPDAAERRGHASRRCAAANREHRSAEFAADRPDSPAQPPSPAPEVTAPERNARGNPPDDSKKEKGTATPPPEHEFPPRSRPGRRLVVPVSRVPRAAAVQQFARRADRRGVRRAQHAVEVPQGLRPRKHRGGVRRAGKDLPRRSVRRVQGASPAHARRPAFADRAAVRSGARHGPAHPARVRRGSRRRDRHAGLRRREREPQRAHLHRRQGHGAAGVAADHADQHHERHDARPRRREDEVRRVSRADHRLPGAGGRQLRQHPGHRQGGTQDRGQVAGQVFDARRAGRRRRQRRRQGGREPARRPRDARARAQARDHPHRCDAAGFAAAAQAPAAGHRGAARAVHAARAAFAAQAARWRAPPAGRAHRAGRAQPRPASRPSSAHRPRPASAMARRSSRRRRASTKPSPPRRSSPTG